MEEMLRKALGIDALIERIAQLEKELAAMKADAPSGKEYLTLKQVQQVFKRDAGKVPTHETLKSWHHKGILIQHKAGKRIYYKASDVYNLKAA
jgi:hypothetical protein